MSDKMQILQIHLSVEQGGAYTVIQNLSHGFEKIGSSSVNIFKDPLKHLKNFNYDMVLLHSFQGRYINQYLDTLLFLEKYKIPYIVLLHDYWPICPQNNLIRINDGLKECKLFNECDPIECGFYKKSYKLSIDYIDQKINNDIYDIIKDAKTVCFNKYSVNIFKKSGFNNIKLIYHGVDFDKFKPLNYKKDKFTVLFTNAWGEKTLKGYKHWEWLKNRDKDIVFKSLLGNKSLSYMPNFYNSGDCLVFLSLWPETFGMVILEALACDIPVISYPIGIAPEIIQDNVNGYLINDYNIRSVYDAIYLIDGKEYNCRESIKQFSIEKMCQNYEEFIS